MAVMWKLQDFLDTHGVTVYALMKETGLSQSTAYRLGHSDTKVVKLATLNKIITALETLTGEAVSVGDVLTYQRDT
jgi:DNA-binding Xre family transcriptional regulator